jgi:hypothetical protein
MEYEAKGTIILLCWKSSDLLQCFLRRFAHAWLIVTQTFLQSAFGVAGSRADSA